ncbi:MAG TPA: FAD-dependent oxidoreductase [Fervidobacterium sp.]|nr:FAD-dependent oxidoreductase [Fervidobacterium sp.]HOM73717.1 FAD-dependent oxidoreductase [Fervidobacterium sp.]HPP17494.1 FAD-dependent oxidoreductase [Fervidobacterium sp.]HRD20391.1 FAD-dependent oxidoreductase [Fervidobacterium sp.]
MVNEGPTEKKHVKALVIGAGPAGLCGAIAIAESIGDGKQILVVDEGIVPGGQLPKQTHKFFGHEGFYASVRGFEIGEKLVSKATDLGVQFSMQTTVAGIYEDSIVTYDRNNNSVDEYTADYLLIATGASERFLVFRNNTLPGVYGAGAVQTLMNQYKVMPGESFLIVGAGNIGLIVAYQLLQAGANVKAIVEASSKIGGYMVHANKIMRLGVPIMLNHTIVSALGEERVQGAIVARVDEHFKPIPGTEKEFVVDTICLAVGLQPSVELVAQTGAEIKYISELGGYVPIRDENMKTTADNVYIAGDLSGIEEASTAMIEGYIAGYNIAQKITGQDLSEKISTMKDELIEFRKGPFASKVREGLKKMNILFPSGGYRERTQQSTGPNGKLRAVIECPQAIPCNPCETSCPTGAINVGKNINSIPYVDYDKCIGCGVCVMKCPGLAIFLLQEKEDYSIVGIPYEFLPIPENGTIVKLFDKDGRYVADGQIDKVSVNRKEKTHLVFLRVPKGMENIVRHFDLAINSEEYVCRCEEVSRQDVEKVIDSGITDYEEIRRILRIGMGPCGGKTCRNVVLQIIAEKTKIPISESKLGAFRPPVIPLPIDAIVKSRKGVDKDE